MLNILAHTIEHTTPKKIDSLTLLPTDNAPQVLIQEH